MQNQLQKKLTEQIQPTHLELLNESPNHGLDATAEKHFRVIAVSARFEGLGRVERHRLVHEAVADELRTHVHALTVQAYSPAEWAQKTAAPIVSPECLGGGKREGI